MGNRQENRLSVVNPHFPDGTPNKVIVIELEKTDDGWKISKS
jgi:hypothetical protein